MERGGRQLGARTGVASPPTRATRQNGAVPLPVKALIVVLVAAMVAVFAYIVDNAVTGPDEVSLSSPDYVERLIPASGSEALSQATVGIDLAEGYDAYLVINGQRIDNLADGKDADGLVKAESLGTVEYDPAPGKRVERLESPRQCVDAWVWRKIDGPETAKQLNWCFKVS